MAACYTASINSIALHFRTRSCWVLNTSVVSFTAPRCYVAVCLKSSPRPSALPCCPWSDQQRNTSKAMPLLVSPSLALLRSWRRAWSSSWLTAVATSELDTNCRAAFWKRRLRGWSRGWELQRFLPLWRCMLAVWVDSLRQLGKRLSVCVSTKQFNCVCISSCAVWNPTEPPSLLLGLESGKCGRSWLMVDYM